MPGNRPSKMTEAELDDAILRGNKPKPLDRDHDGDVDFQDLPEQYQKDTSNDGVPAYDAPSEDKRSNIRELKRLRASDILEERRRAREELEYDEIIREDERRYKEENKSTIRKFGDTVLHGAITGIKEYAQKTQPAPRRQQPARPARRTRYAPEPSQAPSQARQTRI